MNISSSPDTGVRQRTSESPGTRKAELVLAAAQRAAIYHRDSSERSVYPTEAAVENLERFPRQVPDGSTDPADVLAMLDELGSPATVVSTQGRYYGYVTGGTDPAAAAAAVLAGAWDQSVALPVMSPVAARLDELAARWVCELLGMPTGAIATFCSGASIANLTGVLAARDALLDRAGWSVDQRGLNGAPPIRVVASAEIHASVAKALRAAGIGKDAVTLAPTDDAGRVVPERFPQIDARTLVLLQAGNVNTGHSDPFDELVPMVHEQGGWVHVDGAFGLWAAASPAQRHLVAGVELADSWAVDAHKWLNAPYDSGLAICRDPADLRRAMAFHAAYLATGAERALTHLGLQMSQRARGVETWAILASRGRTGVAAMVDTLCEHAQTMAGLLAGAGANVLVPTALNQVLVQFDDDATTDAVIAAVQADGTCWAGGTVWQERHAMRISISDASTTSADVAASAEAILRCWRAVAA